VKPDPIREAAKLALWALGAGLAYALGKWGDSLPTIWQAIFFR
jgi:hypothetical protein